MSEIRREHIEWAVVSRLGEMLKTPNSEFSVTDTFALFSSILCWTLQHIRIREADVKTVGDGIAANLSKNLERQRIADDPWRVQTVARVVRGVTIPSAENFDGHHVLRFLKNLRNAVAHGDARNVNPFNRPSRGANSDLWGFRFACAEGDGNRWSGEITLLESDMCRIGGELARLYCEALERGDPGFAGDARLHVREMAA